MAVANLGYQLAASEQHRTAHLAVLSCQAGAVKGHRYRKKRPTVVDQRPAASLQRSTNAQREDLEMRLISIDSWEQG